MKLCSMIACAALLAFGLSASAWAQPATSQLLNEAVSDCLAANQDKSNPPLDDLAVCEPAFAKIDAAYGGIASPTPHDVNLRHMYVGFVHTAIGGAYGQIDGVRSARLCSRIEASWLEISQIVDANSPETSVPGFKAMRQAAISPVTKCRAEKGTPSGAPPLPQ